MFGKVSCKYQILAMYTKSFDEWIKLYTFAS